MKRERIEGISIRSEEDVVGIPGISEQQLALFLIRERPHLEVAYEKVIFEYVKDDGRLIGTTPDFRITNTRTGQVVYLEITTASLNGKDPKERQKTVMKSHPGVRYTVLYRENLRLIQEKHQDYRFFNGKKMREEEIII